MSDLPLFDPFRALEEVRQEARGELSQKLSQPPARVKTQSNEELISTSATFATFAGVEPANALAPARANDVVCKNSSSYSNTYARERGPAQDPDQSRDTTPAKVAKVATNPLRCGIIGEKSETGPAKVSSPLLREWRTGLNRLSPDRIPCPDYRPEEWAAVLSNAWGFLDAFGPQAEALGWQTHELWGVHPQLGTIRVDHCGAIVLVVGGPVRAVTADTIRFTRVTYYRRPHAPVGTPIWEAAR